MSETPEGWKWITIPELQINSELALRFKHQVDNLLSQNDIVSIKLLYDDIIYRSILRTPLDDIQGELFVKLGELMGQYKLLFWMEVLSDEARKSAINELPSNEKMELMKKIVDNAWQSLGLILIDGLEKIAKAKN